MSTSIPPQRRADAARNRAALLDAATRVFAAGGSEPSMRAVARKAGVGVGTLYRHFPTREALVDAVYRDQLERLRAGAGELLGEHEPADALRRWMDLFGTWVATKMGMLDTLQPMIDAGRIQHAQSRIELVDTIEIILAAGRDAGDLRGDVSADDIAAALVGTFTVAGAPAQAEQATRLLDLLMDGVRTAA